MRVRFGNAFKFRNGEYFFWNGLNQHYRLSPRKVKNLGSSLKVVSGMTLTGLFGWGLFALYLLIRQLPMTSDNTRPEWLTDSFGPAWLTDGSVIYLAMIWYWLIVLVLSAVTWLPLFLSGERVNAEFPRSKRSSMGVLMTRPLGVLLASAITLGLVQYGISGVCSKGRYIVACG